MSSTAEKMLLVRESESKNVQQFIMSCCQSPFKGTKETTTGSATKYMCCKLQFNFKSYFYP